MFFSGVMSFGSVGRHNYKSRRRANINAAYILTAGTIWKMGRNISRWPQYTTSVSDDSRDAWSRARRSEQDNVSKGRRRKQTPASARPPARALCDPCRRHGPPGATRRNLCGRPGQTPAQTPPPSPRTTGGGCSGRSPRSTHHSRSARNYTSACPAACQYHHSCLAVWTDRTEIATPDQACARRASLGARSLRVKIRFQTLKNTTPGKTGRCGSAWRQPAYGCVFNSVRRFLARPSRVSLGAMGRVRP